MMIWETGKRPFQSHPACRALLPTEKGFSLLEMVVAMFIISLLLGMTIMATRNLLEDEELKGATRKLALMAKTARQTAIAENRPYEISMEGDRWTLRPAETEDSAPGGLTLSAETKKRGTVEYLLPADIKMKVRRWGSRDWEKETDLTWYFSATGLCAPNTFRLEKGKAWMQTSFNPLTANMQEEVWELR